MEEIHLKPTIQEVSKHPWAYLLISSVGIIVFLFYQNSDVTSSSNKGCEANNARLIIEIKEERKEKNELYNALLVSTGVFKIIEKKTETDSLKTTKK